MFWLIPLRELYGPRLSIDSNTLFCVSCFSDVQFHELSTHFASGQDASRPEGQLAKPHREFKALPLESDVFMIAVHYGGLYDQKKTLEWLNRAVRDEDGRTRIAIKTAPEFDFLRSDPRFHDLLRRLGFPE